MRLLNAGSLQFEEFFDEETPEYAIISHRWLRNEITYQDFLDGKGAGSASLRKITDACLVAKIRGHEYIWIDTVCIDKKSSAELSEAINAMFKWYRGSQECFVHLADVPDSTGDTGKLDAEQSVAFAESEWFTRGWTLQELLAPDNVLFFSEGWKTVGSKVELAETISRITNIDQPVLEDPQRLSQVIIARKMSWASERQTTRGEDLTYSLLGIFDVNMPLLYGEGGKKAFFRLQLEILKNTRDDSIFAWTRSDLPVSGMLAPWPSAFADSSDLATFGGPAHQLPWNWTNLGLELRLPHYERMNENEMVSAQELLEGGGRPQPAQPLFGRDLEMFTLSCWKTVDPDSSSRNSHWHIADGVVNIRLKRYGPCWRRVNCTKFLLGMQHRSDAGSQFHDVGQLYARSVQPTSYRLLYVR